MTATLLNLAPLILGAIVIAVLLYSAWTDINEFLIPNWASLVIIACFFARAAFNGRLFAYDILWDMGGAALILVLGYAAYAARSFGAGDVKLATAVAAYVGISNLSYFVLIAMLLGGVVSLVLLGLTYVRDMAPVGGRLLSWVDRFRAYMPYGIGIALSGIGMVLNDLTVALR